VQLESALATVQQNFNDERTRRLNVEVSLSNTANDVKEKERSAKELLAHLNRLSAQEGELKATHASLQKENKRLLNRVEELEVNNQHLGRSINAPRPRSTVDDDRAGYLQVQLEELQESHRRQGAELRSTAERLQRAQTQVTQSENEGLAAQKKLRAELQRVQEALEEKDEELAYLRNHAGADSDRERQLLSRIEDEEVKVQTLEFTIRQQAEELRSKGNADRLVRSAEKRAETEARKVEELQNQLSRLRDDLSRADERVDKESHTVSDLSAQLSELQRTHRGVVQEKT
jgi:chromosome segregation ATPase